MELNPSNNPVILNLAQEWLVRGTDALTHEDYNAAQQAFDRAVMIEPILSRNVGDLYDNTGDATVAPDYRRYCHGMAKRYYEFLSATEPPTGTPANVFRADALVRIGNEARKLSLDSAQAYDANANSEAIARYTAAIDMLGDEHMVVAHQGRLLAQAKQLAIYGQRWFSSNKFDHDGLTRCLDDLNTLLTLPATYAQQMERMAICEELCKYPMNETNQNFVQGNIIPRLGSYLMQGAANDAGANVQSAVLAALAALLKTHGWATDAAYPWLQQFVHHADMRGSHVGAVLECDSAVLTANSGYAGLIASDLQNIAVHFPKDSAAQRLLISKAKEIIEVINGMQDISPGQSAVQVIRTIGVQTDDYFVLNHAFETLLHTAITEDDMSSDAITAIADIGVEQNKPDRAHPAYALQTAKYDLMKLLNIDRLKLDAELALFERLGVEAEDVYLRFAPRTEASVLTPTETPLPPSTLSAAPVATALAVTPASVQTTVGTVTAS